MKPDAPNHRVPTLLLHSFPFAFHSSPFALNFIPMEFNDSTYEIIGCAMRVHTSLGPGLQGEAV
jgi:hypothetical protein